MEVTVRLFATLREGRFREKKFAIKAESRVMDILNRCNIPPEEVAICLVNGRHADEELLLHSGDIVSIFPPIGGG